jgi:acyl carrier protein
MTPATIESKLRTIICDELGLDEEAVTLDAHLVHDLGADSLDQVELIMRCEEDFKIEIDDDVADRMVYVKDILKHLVARKTKL